MLSDNNIREPAVAGQFYPATGNALQSQVDTYIATNKSPVITNRILALIVPHAGYRFCGAVSGSAFSCLSGQEKKYKRVIVLAPSHRVGFSCVALSPHKYIRTPLGLVEVEQDTCERIVQESEGQFVFSERVHAHEHSMEVQVPFIQRCLPQAKIIPAVCGQLDLDQIDNVSKQLTALYDDTTMWVISSDFTHYGSSFGYLPFVTDIPEQLQKLDMGAVSLIRNIDPRGFIKYVRDTGTTICGTVPIALFLSLVRHLEITVESTLTGYTTSGETTGDFCHVVSYAGIVFTENV